MYCIVEDVFCHLRFCWDMALLRSKLPGLLTLLLLVAAVLGAQATRNRGHDKQNNSFRKAATGFYQTMSSTFGEENVRAVQKVGCDSCHRDGGTCLCTFSFTTYPCPSPSIADTH